MRELSFHAGEFSTDLCARPPPFKVNKTNETIAASEHRMHQVETLESLIQFLRDRGREDEATELDERREDLLAAASSAERIA